jgi:cyclopropane fatty-acyl-phospholipid synthase-like methyltransferase
VTGRTAQEVGAFYDAHLASFAALYDGCVHAGYWKRGANSLASAQDHLTDVVVESCRVRPGSRVLDAGCGQGGPAVHAAVSGGLHVSGVTVSPGQQEQAAAAARRAGITDLVDFHVADMARLPFPDGHFDAAFAIESLLFHVTDKSAAFAELARVLRPGAVLVMADYISARPMSSQERSAAADVLQATEPCTLEQVRELAAAAGFSSVQMRDISSAVKPSVAHLVEQVEKRRDQLLACGGEEGLAATREAMAQYTGLFLENHRYAVVEARRSG